MTAPWLVAALLMCPSGGVVDRIEGDALVVLGASGVSVIAREQVAVAPGRVSVREGDRLVPGRHGTCRAVAPRRADLDRVRDRLRALENPRAPSWGWGGGDSSRGVLPR